MISHKTNKCQDRINAFVNWITQLISFAPARDNICTGNIKSLSLEIMLIQLQKEDEDSESSHYRMRNVYQKYM
jgi:hypothetical protein